MVAFETDFAHFVERKRPFTIEKVGENFRIKPLNIFAQHQKKKERFEHVASAIACYLRGKKLTPTQAFHDKTVLSTRKWLQNLPKKFQSGKQVKGLSRQLLATKLGIAVSDFETNEGFEKFAETFKLYNYLALYNHRLKVEEGVLSILQDDEYRQWDEPPEVQQAAHKHNKLPWVYGEKGLQSKDLYKWTELEPFKHDDPNKRGRRYVFEYCASRTDSGVLTGTHSWFRLYSPTGDIYSVGSFRPGKSSRKDNIRAPLKTKKGFLMAPHVCEFLPCETKTIKAEITKEQFQNIIKKVNLDKKNEKKLTFQAFGNNCTDYIKNIAEKYGKIKLPMKESIFSLLNPPTMKRFTDKIPTFVKKVCFIVAGIFVNFIQLFLGACLIDKEVKIIHKMKIRAHIGSPCDLLRPSKSEMHHPYTLFRRSHNFVENWRKGQLKKDRDNDQIRYTLPPEEHWKHF